ncbi:MAG: hypothetical protein WDA16_07695 [Candidatus Thermoplasmatota archaeon]
MEESERYTVRRALHEARELLENEFGEVDQAAAVDLAAVLHAARARDEFMRRDEKDRTTPYGF